MIRKGQKYIYVDTIGLGTAPAIKKGDAIVVIKKWGDWVLAKFRGKEIYFHYTYITKDGFVRVTKKKPLKEYVVTTELLIDAPNEKKARAKAISIIKTLHTWDLEVILQGGKK